MKSPSKQRGRDFGIILHCLYLLGYSVEWRVINAAEYGYPQRRRRIFIFAMKQGTPHYSFLKNSAESSPREILFKTGFFADEFKVKKSEQVIHEYSIKEKINRAAYIDLVDFSDVFKAEFENTGFMFNGEVYTAKTTPYKHKQITLNDILEKNDVDERFFWAKI